MTQVAPALAIGVQAQSAYFIENGAGTYTADFVLPEDSTLLDVYVEAVALWDAGTSAALDIGDSADPDGYLAAVNLKTLDLLAGEAISLCSAQTRGAEGGAYATVGTSTHLNRRFSSAKRTISAVITSVGAGTAGRTRITVLYAPVAATTITQ
jgi:hypothetical protein